MKTFVGPSPLAMSSAASATMGQEPAPDPRLQIMLNGPIVGSLLRFAAPTIVVVMVTLHFGGVQLRHFADILSVAGIAPHLWIGIFSNAPDVTSTGQTYLQIVGPFYGCVGAAMIFYFSSQGAGRMLWPFVGHHSARLGHGWRLDSRTSVRSRTGWFVMDDQRFVCRFLPGERAGAEAGCVAPGLLPVQLDPESRT